MMATARMTPEHWRATGASFTWRGHRVFFRVSGSGPPLLLLHGFPTSSWDWRHVWDALASSYRVIALDYVGFGFSDKPADGPYSIFAYADQADALLARMDVERVHVLAHDLGDSVAQELLARDLERRTRLDSVCLLNGGVFPELHRPRPMQKALDSPLGSLVAKLINRTRFGKSFAEVFGPNTQPSQAELDGFWECMSFGGGVANYHLLIRYMRERARHRDRWVLPLCDPETRVPIAMINGHQDPVSGLHVVERLRALAPHTTIFDLAEIGHYPQTEAPKEVLRAYQRFRQSLANGAAMMTTTATVE